MGDIRDKLIPLDAPADVAQILSEQAAVIREKIANLTESLSEIEALKAEVLEMQLVDFKKYADIIVNLEMKNDFYWLIKHFDNETLIQSMSVFTVTMGALIGLPPSLAEIYFVGLITLIAVSLSIASVIGLAVKDTANTSMFSILLFLPSTMLSGIMFPSGMLPKAFVMAGKLFPATWGYAFMTKSTFSWHNLWPLFVILIAAALLCAILLKRIETR